MFRKIMCSHGGVLLASRPMSKLKDHPPCRLSVTYCSIQPQLRPISGGRFSNRNQTTCHAVVRDTLARAGATRDHWNN